MISKRELASFALAPAAAPATVALVLGTVKPVLLVSVASYAAAFILGLPLFFWLRRRSSLAASSLIAAVAGVSVVTASA